MKKDRDSDALQRHHDLFTIKAIKSNLGPNETAQAELAMRRRLEGKVEPLVINGVKFVIDL
jgi:hypothetical protein